MSEISLAIRKVKRSGDTTISLSDKDLYEIPNDIYQLDKIENLDLSKNKISSLDSKLKSFSKLKSLNLEGNKLTTLPFFLTQLSNLQSLNLSGNPLAGAFSKMLKAENQSLPNLSKALNSCFTDSEEELVEEKKNDEPSWLRDETKKDSTVVQNSLLTQLKDSEQKLSEEISKRKKLEEELANLKKSGSVSFSKGDSSNMINLTGKLESRLEIDFNEIEFGEVISQGGFSIVHKGKYKGMQVAIKKIFDPVIRPELLEELQNEVDFMISIRHPSIVFLIGVVSKPPNLCIVMDYLPHGSLFSILHKSK